jgi:hypothetical protein
MNRYAIILEQPNEEAWRRVMEKWPHHHIQSTTIAFIATKEITTTKDIARIVGMSAEENVAGMVFDAKYVSGRAGGGLAEWLSKTNA